MKTKFIKVTFVAAIAMIGAINVFNANKTETLSNIALANVEALAETEELKEGNWIVTVFTTSNWRCSPKGGVCCPMVDC